MWHLRTTLRCQATFLWVPGTELRSPDFNALLLAELSQPRKASWKQSHAPTSVMPHAYILCLLHMNYWWAKFASSHLQLPYTFLKYADAYSSKLMPFYLTSFLIHLSPAPGNPGSIPVVTKVTYRGISRPPITNLGTVISARNMILKKPSIVLVLIGLSL